MINSIHKGFSTFFCKFRLSLNCNHVVRISLIRLFRICSQILLNIREHDVFVNSLVFLMTSNKTVQILISIYYIHSGVSPINPDRSMIFTSMIHTMQLRRKTSGDKTALGSSRRFVFISF